MHLKFEELYTDALLKVDELAERISKLGFTPSHTFPEYLEQPFIKNAKNIGDEKKAVENVLDGLKILFLAERKIL